MIHPKLLSNSLGFHFFQRNAEVNRKVGGLFLGGQALAEFNLAQQRGVHLCRCRYGPEREVAAPA